MIHKGEGTFLHELINRYILSSGYVIHKGGYMGLTA